MKKEEAKVKKNRIRGLIFSAAVMAAVVIVLAVCVFSYRNAGVVKCFVSGKGEDVLYVKDLHTGNIADRPIVTSKLAKEQRIKIKGYKRSHALEFTSEPLKDNPGLIISNVKSELGRFNVVLDGKNSKVEGVHKEMGRVVINLSKKPEDLQSSTKMPWIEVNGKKHNFSKWGGRVILKNLEFGDYIFVAGDIADEGSKFKPFITKNYVKIDEKNLMYDITVLYYNAHESGEIGFNIIGYPEDKKVTVFLNDEKYEVVKDEKINLHTGYYNLRVNPVEDYTTDVSENRVLVENGRIADVTLEFTKKEELGRLQFEIAGAPKEGINMKIDSEPFAAVNNAVLELRPGTYTVEPETISGYDIVMNTQQAQIEKNKTTKILIQYKAHAPAAAAAQAEPGQIVVALENCPVEKYAVTVGDKQVEVQNGNALLCMPGKYNIKLSDLQGYNVEAENTDLDVTAGKATELKIRFTKQTEEKSPLFQQLD